MKHINIHFCKKDDLEKLAEEGRYILHIMEAAGIAHDYPPEDWDLPDAEKQRIQKYERDLGRYAENVISRYYKNHETADFEILPPWLVFPWYGPGTMGWRMGDGEAYEGIFISMVRNLSRTDLVKYQEKYPIPAYMSERYWGSLEKIWKEGIKNKILTELSRALSQMSMADQEQVLKKVHQITLDAGVV